MKHPMLQRLTRRNTPFLPFTPSFSRMLFPSPGEGAERSGDWAERQVLDLRHLPSGPRAATAAAALRPRLPRRLHQGRCGDRARDTNALLEDMKAAMLYVFGRDMICEQSRNP